MSWAVIRSRSPALRTLPSRTVPTLSWRPISLTLSLFPLKAKAEVRAATRSPSTLVRAVMISSVIPSEKYSFAPSGLMFTKGRTAMDVARGGPSDAPLVVRAVLHARLASPRPKAAARIGRSHLADLGFRLLGDADGGSSSAGARSAVGAN